MKVESVYTSNSFKYDAYSILPDNVVSKSDHHDPKIQFEETETSYKIQA